jgi:hypothetical protein
MGKSAKEATPVVLEGLRSGRFHRGWSVTLFAMDQQAAVPFFADDLRNNERGLGLFSAAYLGFSGPLAKDSLGLLQESQRRGGEFALIGPWAIALVKEDHEQAVSLLLRGLEDPRQNYNYSFCKQALERLGPEAAPAISHLVAALKNKTPEVRLTAAVVLGRIGPRAMSAMPSLQPLLKDDYRAVRLAAAEALAAIQRRE